ncbi:hypothetical protein ABZR86_00590 [Dyella marensis]|jgi:hypothetical protein|uniref:3-deoxy-D-arabinoheptulosonate-7-phosphate synthase n=1 Tax=Dyella marensis TaxID=500610 RepID=A0A1I2CFN0_9GAMM|nr:MULTISPECIES: hypothetical protein [Dyella]SFE66915.1 3-deoxy-D-arabinoheptulosonate-7-phosphate synthase [Dyella marensis]
MKRFRFLAVLGISLVASQATAASESLSDFPLKTLPVLINVDAAGKITDASPAMHLPPNLERLLRTNLDEMVSGPAHWKGKAISSQCIINVSLKASPRDDGNYDAGFAYLSSQPVPLGRWHWVNLDGRRLMLASDDFPRHTYPHYDGDPRLRGGVVSPYARSAPPMPAMRQAAAPPPPPPAPAKGR